MGNSNELNKNYDKQNSKNTTKKVNNTNSNKESSSIDDEIDLNALENLIKLVTIIFIVIVIGIFAWFVGKDLLNALGIVNFGTEQIDRGDYTSIIEELNGGNN